MSFIIPNQQTKKIRQLNEGELSGELFVTKNIDLREMGKIKLAHTSYSYMTTDNDADFTYADSMFKSDASIFVISKHLFSGLIDLDYGGLTDRTTDTNSPNPSVEEDGVYFNATEVVSDGTKVKYRSASTTWTDTSLTLSSSHPTEMAVWTNFNSLLVGNNNVVYRVDTSWVNTKTLTLPAEFEITSIDVNNTIAYIATRHIIGGEAKLFTWDGTSSAYSGSYGVNTFEIPTVKKYGGSCALVTSKGELLQFNGSGFTKLGQFPIKIYNIEWGNVPNDHNSISNRGMYVDKDNIYIRLDQSTSESFLNRETPYFVGGLWCYTPDNGLFCINTPSYTKYLGKNIYTSAVDTSTNIITTTSVPITGTPVMYNKESSPAIGGLKNKTIYYVIYLSSTTLKLAETYSDAIAGTAIDLTGTGNSFQYLYFFLTNDYGWSYAGNRGSIEMVNSSIINSFTGDDLVFSARLFGKQSETGIGTFNLVSPVLPNRGYFITPKLNSTNLEDIYNQISLKYKPLKTDESIIIKYKNIDKLGLPFSNYIPNENAYKSGTWSDTDTFTTTIDMSNASVGDEIEITGGVGAGCLFHISSLSENSGTWTVNLDETFIFASANDIFYFKVDNWKYLDSITSTNQNGQEFKTISLDKNSKFLQLKVELRGVDVTIEELQVNNKSFIKSQ